VTADLAARVHQALSERLSADSLAHSERTAETAVELAERYGVDPESARLAGLAHDWERDADGESLLSAAAALDLVVSEADRAVPYLLHSRVGAVELAAAFPELGDDVLHAVASHTCGGREMSDLAKVVYVADMIEECRDFPGVAELREAVDEVDLDELFARAYARSMLHLVGRRRFLHPVSVETWNAHAAGRP
jgi:predicted HD superfamily hydrolase involved in NAD metabolism